MNGMSSMKIAMAKKFYAAQKRELRVLENIRRTWKSLETANSTGIVIP